MAGTVLLTDLSLVQTATTLEGSDIEITNLSPVIDVDVLALNGVIHVIDTVLIPPSDENTGGTPWDDNYFPDIPHIDDVHIDSAARATLAGFAAAVAFVL